MGDFFEPPPAPPEPERHPRYRSPAWLGPPEGVLPGVVALELVLARNERAAVCVTRAAAYPAGVTFDLLAFTGGEEEFDPMLFHHHRHGRGTAGEIPPERLRFGVQFPDGSKVTNIAGGPFGWAAYADDEDDDPRRPPKSPVLVEQGGGGGGGSWRQSQWLWPLPGPGTLELVVEWPALDIPLTRMPVEAKPIIEAAARAQVLFELPEPPDSAPGGFTISSNW